MKTTPLLLEKLSFSYPSDPDNLVFKSLSARISLDCETLVLGGNASGKTTLARLLGGLDEPVEGRILWPPQTGQSTDDHRWVPLRAGVVFENPRFQFQSFTVKEELEAGLIYRGAGSGERRHALGRAAAELGLEPYLEMEVNDLEAPLQLAVLVAGFLLLAPSLLILDFSLTLLERTFRESLLRQCRAPSGPALVVLSRCADDLALVGPQAGAFVLGQAKMKELSASRDDLRVLEILENADIRLPWYAYFAAGLFEQGLTSAIFYESEKELAREITDALRRRKRV